MKHKLRSQDHSSWIEELGELLREPESQALFASTIELLERIVWLLPASVHGHYVTLLTLTIELLRTVQKTGFRIASSRRTQF